MRTKPENIHPNSIPIYFEGPYAHFAIPGIERMTYEIPPVSAMIGAVSSIYWKPQIQYIIDRLEICSDFRTLMVTTNELNRKVSTKKPIDVSSIQTQRSSHLIVDPKYIVWVRPILVGHEDPASFGPMMQKHMSILKRRVEKGQCFQTPYLGRREFSAAFRMATDEDNAICASKYIGAMPFLRDYATQAAEAPSFMVQGLTMIEGKVDYPRSRYKEIYSGANLD